MNYICETFKLYRIMKKNTFIKIVAAYLLLGTVPVFALNVSGPTRVCPGSNNTYTFSSNVTGVICYKIAFFRDSNVSPSQQGSVSGNSITLNFTNDWGTNRLEVKGYLDIWGLIEVDNTTINILREAPEPATPNNGLVVACGGNDNIGVSSLPSLQNNSTDCYFHCEFQWSAPSGWQINTGGPIGNPVLGGSTMTLVSPNSIGTGWLGQLTATAFYSNCAQPQNTDSNANIWGGLPTIFNPRVNGSASQSANFVTTGQLQLDVTSNGATNWNWTVESGTGSVSPVGPSCSVSFSNFVRIRCQATNRCGNGQSYIFYLVRTSYNGYKIYPNPASSTLKVEFEYAELAEIISEVKLYSENQKEVINLDVKKLQKEDSFKTKLLLRL